MNSPIVLLAATSLVLSTGRAQTPPDLTSGFDAGAEDWRTSDAGALLAWQANGGANGAFLQGTGPGGEWHFVSPPAWAGDWSAYRALRFDEAIPSRHYADDDRGDMVVIVGTNAETMTWNGPTPLWTWTHFEISLDPQSFGVDQATFDGIMAEVAELRILAEFTTAGETVALDNVRVTATPIQVHSEDLVERFTYAVANADGSEVAGWTRVDDVTLSVEDTGRPSRCLHGNDWMDGRTFKIASPRSWAGDWRGFAELSFDFLWDSSSGDKTNVDLVTVFGANGQQLVWRTDFRDNEWKHHSIPLTPVSFGVDPETFDGVMAYVNQIWIRGEYDGSDDQAYLDNVVLSTGPLLPRRFETSLVSRFGADAEGWIAVENCALAWEESGGLTGGYITGQDTGGGTAKLQSPDAWAGDWSNFRELRFFLKPLARNQGDFPAEVWIMNWDGAALYAPLPIPYRTWTPYTVDLDPETFGVTPEEFEAIIADVACVWIRTDIVSGTGGVDTTGLDEVSLIADSSRLAPPPERFNDFLSGAEGWRGNGWSGAVWEFNSNPADHRPEDGNPDGCIIMPDAAHNAAWLSPEAWAGDWRGYESVAFDIKIINGSEGNLLGPGWMVALVSTHGSLFQDCLEVPVPQAWKHYEFTLSPTAFGVTPEEFDTAMRDVIAISIRSEWINYDELEALDNVRLSKAPEAYWIWLAGYLDPAQLADESIAGKWADADDDGATNWDEFMALTVPNDASSRFAIIGTLRPEGFAIDYPTRTGRHYQVWQSTDLGDADAWEPVGPLETGNDLLQRHLAPRAMPAMFFKVTVQMPEP
ncbi:MAG: hypothetical protein H7A47_00885 [Verrucomicrobiales bacterium]|nr:hypothetical protein [Verrucomicrobiales bacterium]